MTYYSEKKYAKKDDLWFERFCFNRWFEHVSAPILDIGCATGNFVAVNPGIIEGIDIDKDSLKIAMERGLNARYLDAEKMNNLSSNHYNGIFAKQVIEHLDNPLEFMKQIHRVLKPGGRAVLLTPNCPWALRKFFWDDYTHKQPFTLKSLKTISQDSGFSKLKISYEYRSFPGLGWLFRNLKLHPDRVAQFQNLIGIKSLALILIVEK
ncbi:MAG: hypothetical protein COU81_03575 [Candidatus Portnoybacteria bacterium CG10_big_fil_rev_8_21_14_0_10_36_7]|uniref:Methyltransferase type 11 domain-containing protein n=1 Tax=Candidatus Portnoybacteria bacterium CG10_big_fil_rev_8_21_14_0_10_36_7 TaxID=1974812 RepID=A0A2M8KDC9_9BACT|nr:MAG: hypothetical protein COU81_03575 [Candidatus Portnoybacteria bacterium CG10_big_fil_rev_8_21_14_0_10_36_7]